VITLHDGKAMKIAVVNQMQTTSRMLAYMVADYQTHLAALSLDATRKLQLKELVAKPEALKQVDIDRFIDLHPFIERKPQEVEKNGSTPLKASM
jgi:hypothetical protein